MLGRGEGVWLQSSGFLRSRRSENDAILRRPEFCEHQKPKKSLRVWLQFAQFLVGLQNKKTI